MANSKIQLADGTVLLDLTSDTVAPEVLVTGYTAHNAAGEPITGTAQTGGKTTLKYWSAEDVGG